MRRLRPRSTRPGPRSVLRCSISTKLSTNRDAMNPLRAREHHIARREFLQRGAVGLGTAALAYLLGRNGLSAAVSAIAAPPEHPTAPRFGGLPGVPHLAPKAKRVINL